MACEFFSLFPATCLNIYNRQSNYFTKLFCLTLFSTHFFIGKKLNNLGKQFITWLIYRECRGNLLLQLSILGPSSKCHNFLDMFIQSLKDILIFKFCSTYGCKCSVFSWYNFNGIKIIIYN